MDGKAQAAKAVYHELEGVQSRPERENCLRPWIQDEHDLAELDKWSLIGLAFSGGGIRSATFNLGVLQALEELGVLKYIDYLSTVSGGGYIGSWYLACLKRGQNDNAKREGALEHLRKYSQYLAPEAGFFSADTWTIVTIWLRNTALLQAMLVSLFAIALLLPRVIEILFRNQQLYLTLALANIFFARTGLSIYRYLSRLNSDAEQDDRDGQKWVQVATALPALAAAYCLASALWQAVNLPGPPVDLVLFLLPTGALVAVATGLFEWASLIPERRRSKEWKVGLPLIGLLCGAIFMGLGYLLAGMFRAWAGTLDGEWLAALIGAPALLVIVGVSVVLQLGLLGRAIQDSSREWWARLGAFLIIYTMVPLALGLTVLYGPQLAALLADESQWKRWSSAAAAAGGILTTVGGLFAARSPETGKPGSSSGREVLSALAPYVFIAGLLILVATGLHAILRGAPGCEGIANYWRAMNCSVDQGQPWVWYALAVSAAVLLLLARRVDINEASMNPFYRNRLTRCYQGAAREADGQRKPSRFTGFDADDDFHLSGLQPRGGYDGPVPIINTALNLTGGGDAGLAERRAASYFFTPYRTGSDKTGVIDTKLTSRSADGMHVGACVATSGAAASPNMGYHTSSSIAFLLTFFNVRLGLWTRSPACAEAREEIRWGAAYLLRELFGTASHRDNYIYLSDGGHFENLGVYELVRRRCKYIIAGDAEQDGAMTLESLGGLVRKCRIDFGVEIDIDTSEIRALSAEGHSRAHCAVGRIYYDWPDKEKNTGYLIYLKASLTGDESSDILQYKAQNKAFPHQSTGDQFFSESQFESYRSLGRHIAQEAFRPAAFREEKWKSLGSRGELSRWVKDLERGWTPASPFTQGNFTRHTDELADLWDAARQDPDLGLLDPVLFLGWTDEKTGPAAASGDISRRKALYLCQRVLQLMENAYLDLQLETSFHHPDNKGWKEVFLLWGKSRLLKETYRRSKDAYGIRFRAFCERELEIEDDS